MYRQKKGPLSSLIANRMAGLITRREFVQRAVRLGLAGSLVELLDSCGNTSPPRSTIDLTWCCESPNVNDGSNWKGYTEAYNIINKDEISVKLDPKGSNTDYLHEQLIQGLQNQQPSPEIFSMDVIWTDEFASNGWVIPLNDFWSAEERDHYLHPPLLSSTYQGKVYVAPLWTDVGLMYYRTDLDFGRSLSDTIPQPWTWHDLEGMVQYVRSRNGSDLRGYLWQTRAPSVGPYEGLVCNFVEVLSSYGGNVVDNPLDPKLVIISSSAATEALREMRLWLAPGGISSSMKFMEDTSEDAMARIWERGGAMFMRNWPMYISTSSKDDSAVQDKFGITTFPGKTLSLTGKSCIGGWGLAINRFAPKEKQEAAWKFISWMLQEEMQVFLAIDQNFLVTRKEAYGNRYLNEQNPFYSKIKDIIENYSQSRPKIKMYQSFTQVLQKQIYQILTAPSPDIEGSLKTLQKTLQDIIDKGH